MNETTKAIIDNIFEELIALQESIDGGAVSIPTKTKEPMPEKVEMLTIKESTELIGGLSEHTVRQLVAQGKVKSVRTGEGKRGKILVNKADSLKEYMEGFQKRNPNFYVFNAVLHMDEATPHLHIDYIPVGHYKRGQDIQNGIAQALKEMGYGTGKMAIAKWRAAEVEVLNTICREHGIEPLAPEKSRGSLEVAEYKEQRYKADELAEQNAQADAEIGEKRLESEKLDKQIEAKLDQVKEILNYIPDYEKEFKIKDECEQLSKELSSLLDGKLSIMKHKDDIIAMVQKLCKLVKKVNDNTYKSGDTIYALREEIGQEPERDR